MPHPSLLPPIRMTRAEFDAWAPYQEIPYELIDGRVEPKYLSDDGLVAMAGGRAIHHALITKCSGAMDRRRAPDCTVLSDARVRVSDVMVFIPDVSLTCEIIDLSTFDLVAPRLIVDVLSPSTQRQDRTTKLNAYRQMPTLMEIWFVRPESRHVEVWQRQPERWSVADVIGNGLIHSMVLTSSVPLDELYDRLAT